MILEYDRWGYKKLRKIIASLQFLGGLGYLGNIIDLFLEDRILDGNKKDNFWEMGDVG